MGSRIGSRSRVGLGSRLRKVASLLALAASGLWVGGGTLSAQTPAAAGTAFSYQGRLMDNGVAANGTYDVQFTLFDASTGGATVGSPVVSDDVSVSAGLFTVMLDFGAAFDGHARWLEIAVRPGASTGVFTPLAGRQPITPAPHALFSASSATSATSASTPWTGVTNIPAGFADNIDNDALGALSCGSNQIAKWNGAAWSCTADNDTVGALLCGSNQVPKWNGAAWSCAADNDVLRALSCGANQIPKWNGAAWSCMADNDSLGGLGCGVNQVPKWNGAAWACATDADDSGTNWSLAGNAGVAGVTFLGTTNNVPLELRMNGQTVWRSVPSSDSGFSDPNVVAGPANNAITGHGSAIGGGVHNTISSSYYSVIAGGSTNTASGTGYDVIGGGISNGASGFAATVAGGNANNASGSFSVVGGGQLNSATSQLSVVSGGFQNLASGSYATVPGGIRNQAAGNGAFAAGRSAHAIHDGTFVWSDSRTASSTPTESTGNDQFIVGATGGVWFGGSGATPSFTGYLNTGTGAYLTNGGVWTNASDRNLKEQFEAVDGRALLDTLARLPVMRWSYKKEPGVRHIGPTAQDFQAVFGFGGDDKTITTLDPAGIALRAIQELDRANHDLQATAAVLRRTVDEQAAKLATLDATNAEVAALKVRLAALEASPRPRPRPRSHRVSSRASAGAPSTSSTSASTSRSAR
jgi:hypothetical protein